MSYEAWRITYQSSEQAARAAYMGYQQQKHRADSLLGEIRGYLVAASDGSMSRNNSEQLAAELLKMIDA